MLIKHCRATAVLLPPLFYNQEIGGDSEMLGWVAQGYWAAQGQR